MVIRPLLLKVLASFGTDDEKDTGREIEIYLTA